MCGIFASNDPIINYRHEKIINKYLSFRGPDNNSGLIKLNNWQVYHSRLAIIAPTKEFSQPFLCKDGSIILYNGEIFNYKEISKKINNPLIFSDTELLSEVIVKKKFNPNVLDGFFSIVRISKDGELLNCIRDPFGVKPLFYYKRKKYITISSETSVIKKIFNLKFSKKSLVEYKIFRYPIFQGSYYNTVKSVKPGTCLINKKYFDLIKFFKKKKSPKKNLKNLVKQVLKERQLSDVPIGLLLSSGVDSNIIRNLSKNFKNYFCGGFKNDADLIFCKKFKKNNKINIDITEITPKIFIKKFKDLIKLRCEPLSVPNEVVLSIIASKAKKRGIKVLLSGEGADEFFAGYDRIYRWARYTKNFSVKKFCELYCYSKIDSNNFNKVKKFFTNISFLSNFNKIRFFFIKFHLPILLRRLDFSLMSSGVEGREPFVGKKIFFESLKYNSYELINKKYGKIPLRRILSKFMGNKFSYGKKIGFPINVAKAFNINNKSNYKVWFQKNLEEIKKI